MGGVVQANAGLQRYTTALGILAPLVRLVMPPEESNAGSTDGTAGLDAPGLHWHLARAPELNNILDKSDLPMTVVGNDGPPLATARVVLTAIGRPLVAPS